MKVKAWMTANVETVTPDTSVRRAFLIMKKKGVLHLPVCKGGKLVGIVTDRDLRRPKLSDIFKEWHELYRLGEEIDVGDVMTSHVITATPETDLLTAASMLLEKKIGALPVVDAKGKLVGIVTSVDLLKAFVRNTAAAEFKTRKNSVLPS